MKLSGHTILVTGGSAGIGLAFATKFLALGNEVIITGRRKSRLAEVKSQHPRLHTIASDVSDAASVAALSAEVKARFPGLDVLMNNAGVMVSRNLGVPAADLAALTSEIEINVNGTIRTTSALMDVIRANRGTIINVSSALAFVPLTSAPIYCAAKAAIHSYTSSLRFQLKDAGVHVVELMPPAVKTELSADLSEGNGFKLGRAGRRHDQGARGGEGGDPARPGQPASLALTARAGVHQRHALQGIEAAHPVGMKRIVELPLPVAERSCQALRRDRSQRVARPRDRPVRSPPAVAARGIRGLLPG
jgi:uncharacterized oxidoreductase